MSSAKLITLAAFAAVSVGASACAMNDMGSPSASTAAMPAAASERTTMVGGAAMYPSRTIVQNAVNSADHTTLVTAVQAGGLVDTLNSPGPFTVFAPTNAAFAKLPAGAVDALVQPASHGALVKVLTYHVVAGRMTSADLMAAIRRGGGRATLSTVQGEPLTATAANGMITLTDAHGGMSHVTIADVMQSNGVIHVVDTVLLP